MKNITSFFQTLLLRQVLTIFLVAFTFLTAPIFTNSIVANAETVASPEGVYYKGTPDGLRKNDQNNNKSVFDASEATKNNPQNRVEQRRENSSGENVLTPEGAYYKGTPDDSIHNRLNNQNDKSVFDASQATRNNPQNKVAKSENPIEEAIETVREKLNLDEKLPRSTKEFLKETEEAVEETVEPITGTRKGYYQIP